MLSSALHSGLLKLYMPKIAESIYLKCFHDSKLVVGNNTNNWVDLARIRDYWRALVNAALNLWFP
jgi:hypothetical protein